MEEFEQKTFKFALVLACIFAITTAFIQSGDIELSEAEIFQARYPNG